jgi:hypothetical protein
MKWEEHGMVGRAVPKWPLADHDHEVLTRVPPVILASETHPSQCSSVQVLLSSAGVMSSFSGVSSLLFLFFFYLPFCIRFLALQAMCRAEQGSYVRRSERLPISQQPPESLPLYSHHRVASSRPTLNPRPLVSTRHCASVDLYF